MAHGGYDKRRVAGRNSSSNRIKGPAGGVNKKPKTVSLKNQMRSIQRTLRKDLPPDVRETQEKKLEGIKKQQEIHNRLALERKIFLRDRKIKFFERRKIERRIRRLEKTQRSSSGQPQEAEAVEQLSKLKEDLEYVRFFPKTEKYVSLFSGSEDAEIVDSRNKLRKQIKVNLVSAAASGKDLEETGSEEDGLLDLSDDDFFAAGSSSDEGDADDELTDKSAREQTSSASGKATSGMSCDEKNQKQISARALMPPPRPSASSSFTSSRNNGPFTSTRNNGSFKSARNNGSFTSARNNGSFTSSTGNGSRFGSSSRKKPLGRSNLSSSGNTLNSRGFSSSSDRDGSSNPQTGGQTSNVSSSSDAPKPRRKRRPKKKKQQA